MPSSRKSSTWWKFTLALAGVGVLLLVLNVVGQGLNTLDRLTLVEHDRDGWQRAPGTISQLALHNGSRVVDFGCGAGYFALKLAQAVGPEGSVQAVDILRLPLAFVWIRAFQRGAHNLRVVLGDADDPHISGPVDAILVANTYHELSHPAAVLGHLRAALVPEGRLVIADRGQSSPSTEHAIDPALVEAELRRDGFRILTRDDHFLDQPDEGPWWLIVAAPLPGTPLSRGVPLSGTPL
jgi:ubiquinone/menaquinone biosynthesis C-methylase UbiE